MTSSGVFRINAVIVMVQLHDILPHLIWFKLVASGNTANQAKHNMENQHCQRSTHTLPAVGGWAATCCEMTGQCLPCCIQATLINNPHVIKKTTSCELEHSGFPSKVQDAVEPGLLKNKQKRLIDCALYSKLLCTQHCLIRCQTNQTNSCQQLKETYNEIEALTKEYECVNSNMT